MEEVDDLVITPFREIVEKGKTAASNAGNSHAIMAKASYALVKEGERALRRIEPLCRKHLEDYGHNFIASLKDNDEIASYRSELNDLLWEFDDYTEPEDFVAEKFSELQGVSRKAAPRIYDILMRLKLDSPILRDDSSSRGSFAQLPTPTSPSSNQLGGHQRASGSSSHSHDASHVRSIEHATAQLRDMMRPSSRREDHDARQEQTERPPPPPSTNPWDYAGQQQQQQQQQQSYAMDESPILPPSALAGERVTVVPPQPSASSMTSMSGPVPDHLPENRRSSSNSTASASVPAERYGSFHTQRSRGTFGSIPENSAAQSNVSLPQTYYHQGGQSPHPNHLNSHYSRRPSDTESSVPDHASMFSLDSNLRPPGSFSAPGFSPMTNVSAPAMPPPSTNPEVMPADFVGHVDSGLIPVEEEKPRDSKQTAQTPEEIERCKITDASSFRLNKGFCEGAKEVFRGGIGVKKTKKPGFSTTATVARCVACLYEMDFNEIETDVNKNDKGNFTRSGINFRVRFLQKSHLATKRADDVQYGCLFCVQQGHTTDECDATVFFSQKALFDHLARHPRPLPDIPGLCVIDQAKVPEQHRNDYDIHFRKPPVPHPAKEMGSQIAAGASGVAKEHARRLFGQRLPYDRSAALELAAGARITGLTWPPQHQGEWLLGWHDGNWASVPADIVKIDLPPSNMVKFDKNSCTRAKARWKFHVKEKDKSKSANTQWLKFDRNETISNITCTNAKGKSGLFPAAFLDMNTIQGTSKNPSDRAGLLTEEKHRAQNTTVFGKLRAGKGHARRSSLTGSVNSGETALSAEKRRRFAPSTTGGEAPDGAS